MRLGLLLLFLTACIQVAPGQNYKADWYALDMGFASSASGNFIVKSVAGQPFVGEMRLGNMMVETGFLVDTLAGARVVSVRDRDGLPATFALRQNNPNPFNPSTTIQFELPRSSKVVLKLFNILGQQVQELVNDEKPAGVYRLTVDARGLASGVYFYRIEATGGGSAFVETKKMIVLR